MEYRGDGPPATMAYRGDAGQRRLRARANSVSVPIVSGADGVPCRAAPRRAVPRRCRADDMSR
jgi:hypothetical protein